MKIIARITSIILLTLHLEATADEPIKCTSQGKTLYTDDKARCTNGTTKPINGNIVISSPTKISAHQQSLVAPLEFPSSIDGFLQHFGMSQQELADGWKTVMEAKKRGAWKAPDMPDDDK